MTANEIAYQTSDYRESNIKESIDANGNYIAFKVIEELIEGRWEGYVTIVREHKASEL